MKFNKPRRSYLVGAQFIGASPIYRPGESILVAGRNELRPYIHSPIHLSKHIIGQWSIDALPRPIMNINKLSEVSEKASEGR